jgi:hypothetical protein
MSRTARTTLHLCRAGVAAATAAVLLTACGGDGDESSSGSAETSGTAGADTSGTAPSGESEFCARAEEIDSRVEAALSGIDDADPSVTDAFRQIAVELRDIEPPDAISQDWAELSAGLERMAEAFADFDITDAGSLEALEEAEGNLTTASDNVDQYLSDECGI